MNGKAITTMPFHTASYMQEDATLAASVLTQKFRLSFNLNAFQPWHKRISSPSMQRLTWVQMSGDEIVIAIIPHHGP